MSSIKVRDPFIAENGTKQSVKSGINQTLEFT